MFQPKPFNEGFLEEQDGHKVYFAQYGNAAGEAIVSMHGGPGSSGKPRHAQSFDLEKYRVITFDQRGCGKSEPLGELKANTTQKLAEDAERLRELLGIEKWFVTGGSWGSTLSLVYAEMFPERVKGIMISAIFLADKASFDWSFSSSDGVAQLFSDVWEERIKILSEYDATEKNAARVLVEKLDVATEEDQKKIAADVLNWEGNIFTASSDVSYMTPDDVSESDVLYAKTFLHYEANNCFLSEYQLINNISNIKDLPMIIVHGRYDVLCPFQGAWDLHKAHPKSQIVALPQSNHMFTADGNIAKKYIFNII